MPNKGHRNRLMGIGELAQKTVNGNLGHLQTASQICDALDECIRLSDMMRADLFGEGEASASQDAPRNNNLDSLLQDALNGIRVLQAGLESTAQRINPSASRTPKARA